MSLGQFSCSSSFILLAFASVLEKGTKLMETWWKISLQVGRQLDFALDIALHHSWIDAFKI